MPSSTVPSHAVSDDDIQKDVEKILEYLSLRRETFPKATGLDTYIPHSTDVIVSTFPKAGTTLTQQLAYQVAVATGGAPSWDPNGDSFSDICEAAPWVDYIPQLHLPPSDCSPRIFKTHASVGQFDMSTQKHIIVLRNPLKFPGSWLNFTADNYPDPLLTDASDAVRRRWFDHTVESDLLGLCYSSLWDSGAMGSEDDDDLMEKVGPWFEHTGGWLRYVGHPNVLVMFYEDMVKDMGTAARLVASFMRRSLSDDALLTVVQRCSREYMSNGDMFKSLLDAKIFGTDGGSSKVREAARVGFTRYEVSEEHKKEFSRQMKLVFGVSTYSELRDDVLAKQREAIMSRVTA